MYNLDREMYTQITIIIFVIIALFLSLKIH